MKETLIDILRYLLDVVLSTGGQLLILLGPLLFLALLMNFVARQSESLGYKVFGYKGYLFIFGWLGTSIHEFGHAFFAIIFGHKITDITLFTMKEGGSLGHVNHSFNPSSFYQNIGNFFIGIGPILFGSLVLYIISWLMFDLSFDAINSVTINAAEIQDFSSIKALGLNVWANIQGYFNFVTTGENTTWWKILLLIYLLFSIGSSITLSKADISGATEGFVFFVFMLLGFNLFTLWMGDFTKDAFAIASSYVSSLYFLIILSMIINLGFIITLVFINIIKKMIF
jgi:hypothetical protein